MEIHVFGIYQNHKNAHSSLLMYELVSDSSI